MFKNFFLENAFLWFVRAMKVAVIAEKITQPPSILSLFSLSYTYATATLSGENIHLHVLHVYVNKVVIARTSVKSHSRGRGLFSVDISGTSSVK